MNNDAGQAPEWMAPFLSALIVTGSVRQAVDEAGVDFETAWMLRQEEEEFAYYWDRAVRAHGKIMSGQPYWETPTDNAVAVASIAARSPSHGTAMTNR